MHTITTIPAASPLREGWQRFTSALIRGLNAHIRVQSRRDRIERLEAKTDAELAQMGLRRDQILYHVFRDLFYT